MARPSRPRNKRGPTKRASARAALTEPGQSDQDAAPKFGQLPDKPTLIRFLQQQPGRLSSRDVARAFGLKGEQRLALKDMLQNLAEEGAVEGNRRHSKAYVQTERLPPIGVVDIIERDNDGELLGRLVMARNDDRHDRKGPPAPSNVLILPGRDASAVPGIGDRILAHLAPTDSGKIEARIIRKLGQSAHRILGVYQRDEREGCVMPVDRKAKGELAIDFADSLDAVTGELVLVELLPERGFGPRRARVCQRLVDVTSPRAISLIAVHAHGIPVDFPPEAIEEAEQAKPARIEGARIDLQHLPLVTIDPPDARDHDDAVYAELDSDPDNPDGFIIWVAIADVAYYVRPQSALDHEAFRRGNSVYLPDRVVPMLPERLSTDLCSLTEGDARPCLVVRMVFDAEGVKRSHEFKRAMMRCAASLHYAQVQRAIDGQVDDKTAPILERVIRPLYIAYAALAKARDRRGPLDLDLPERKVELAPDGRVANITLRERLDAHRLIEEFMIQANVSAAETLERGRMACLYRVHEVPTIEKLEALRTFLKTLDLKIAQGEVLKPASFNRLLEQVRESPHRQMINELVLRSQTQAYYGPDRLGHFGLALMSYAHFTSPIRRYADLLVHRGLIRALHLGSDGLTGEEMGDLTRIGEVISQHERRAMAAERESTDRFLAAFMSDKVGAIFQARISSVTRFGLFVALNDTGADGLIPISSLGPGYYRHDTVRHALIAERGRDGFRLGDRIRVRLEEATPLTGGLRFSVVRSNDDQNVEPAAGHPRTAKPSRLKRAAKRQSAT